MLSFKLNNMKRIVNILIDITQSILTSPVKLPERIIRIGKYAAFILQIIRQILDMQEKDPKKPKPKGGLRYVFR